MGVRLYYCRIFDDIGFGCEYTVDTKCYLTREAAQRRADRLAEDDYHVFVADIELVGDIRGIGNV